ncbi:MAG: AMP-binding protein, partial [Methylocella sp.]
ATATPDAVAVRFEDSALTYRELIMRADRVAWRLIAAGVERETPVAIYLDRSAELAVAMLAVLKAGGAYVPLDPIYPPARIHAIISEADVKIALTSATLEDGIKAVIPVCIGIGEAGVDSAEEPLPLYLGFDGPAKGHRYRASFGGQSPDRDAAIARH